MSGPPRSWMTSGGAITESPSSAGRLRAKKRTGSTSSSGSHASVGSLQRRPERMRFYRALLHLLPRSFRAEYGGEMIKDFSHQWNAANGAARIVLILATLVDVMANAARVHADMLVQDLKYAARSLRRTPGFTLTAILVSAIGIGATTAAFTLADHVLIRALPFPQPDRLVKLWEEQASRGYPRMEPSPPNFRDWQRQATSFERLEAYTSLVGG